MKEVFVRAAAVVGRVVANPIASSAVSARLVGVRPTDYDRVLATVLFTDVVGATEHAVALGDRRWRELLDRHHAMVRRELAAFRGREIDTAGDGFFASFDGPARAIRAAQAITAKARLMGLDLRAGLHTGECEIIGSKLAGIAVHIGARVAALAGAGEVLVSNTVKDLVAGSGLMFEDRGAHTLKGVPGEWRVYGVKPLIPELSVCLPSCGRTKRSCSVTYSTDAQLLSAALPNNSGLLDSCRPYSTEVRLAAKWSTTALLALPALLWMLTSCAQQAPKATTAPATTQSEHPSSPQRAAREQRPTTPSPSGSTVESVSPQNFDGFADEPALKDIFFEPDRADIVGEQAIVMRANARWLLARWLIQNLQDLVLIEGHTDDTGTRQDQLAIAELRAQAVASFLKAMNVPASRLLAVSYGSDRPVCTAKSDACAAKNRRVHFRVKRQ